VGDGCVVRVCEATVNDEALFARIYQGHSGAQYLAEARKYTQDGIHCSRDICNSIYDTRDRFPAQVQAIHLPGIWLQVHHVEERHHEQFFRDGLIEMHRRHDTSWHGVS
jgi:hypothetical protein